MGMAGAEWMSMGAEGVSVGGWVGGRRVVPLPVLPKINCLYIPQCLAIENNDFGS